jgi:hypothetical protein
MKNPRKVLANPQALCYGIGDFYVELTAHLVGGTAIPNGNGSNVHIADIDHAKWDARLEVKGGGSSSNGVNIFVSQLEDHLEGLGREREYCLYFIYRYQAYLYSGHDREPTTCITRSAKTLGALYRELANRTLTLHAVDVRVLYALRARESRSWRDNRVAPTIRLWRHTLNKLVPSVPELTRAVGFRNGYFETLQGTINVVFAGRAMSFPYVFVVPRELGRRVARRLATFRESTLNFD